MEWLPLAWPVWQSALRDQPQVQPSRQPTVRGSGHTYNADL